MCVIHSSVLPSPDRVIASVRGGLRLSRSVLPENSIDAITIKVKLLFAGGLRRPSCSDECGS